MSGINEILNSRDGPVVDAVSDTTNRARSLSRKYVNTDTGAMEGGIRSSINIAPFQNVTGLVESTDPASMWVENGTGERARSGGGGLLRPKNSKVFKFPDRRGFRPDASHRRQSSGFAYIPYSRGQEPQEFMWRGLRDATRASALQWRLDRET